MPVTSTPVPIAVKSAVQIRTDYLRTLESGLIGIGVPTPNVGYGSDYYAQGQALATEIEPIYAAVGPALDQQMPDTATGPNLARIMAIFAPALDPPRPAGPSSGNIISQSSQTTYVVLGAQLSDATGNAYSVSTAGAYPNGATIPVVSVASGQGTNLAPGTALKWASPPPFMGPIANVDANGLKGGIDAESDDDARARLLAFLGSPPTSGNAAQTADAAEGDLAAVEAAFVYPNANGPGTVHVAITSPQSSSSTQSRAASSVTVASSTAQTAGFLPEFVELGAPVATVTATVDLPADVAFYMALPAAEQGAGWIDTTPFPAPATRTAACTVTVVTSSTSITIGNCAAAPVAGNTICVVINGTLVTSHVLTVSGSGPAYGVTLDMPLVANGVTVGVGAFIFPGATNTQNYVAAALETFAAMGPGEKTNAAGLLPRALRRPYWYVAWDYNIGPKHLKAIDESGDEVLDVQWCWQNNGVTVPPLPSAIASGPYIFVPRFIGFYQE